MDTDTTSFTPITSPGKPALSNPSSVKSPGKKRVRFRSRCFSISELESLEDAISPESHELHRSLLISLPSTLRLCIQAISESDQKKAVEIYDVLIQRSCLINNTTRKQMVECGGGQRMLCLSKNPRRAKSSSTGCFVTEPEWIEQFPDESKDEICKCHQCTALAGDKDSRRLLGVMFARGFLAEKDYNKAVAFWKSAIPHRDAYFDLAQYYENSGVPENEEKAFEMYVMASEMNHPQALYEVALAYLDSEGSPDPMKGLELLTSSADGGHALAELELGEVYSNGQIIAEDPVKAVFYYQRAADRGISQAQWIVAQAYESGYGVEKSMEKAMHWYLKAAEKDHAEAQRTLGYFYELGKNGEGVLDQDLEKAVYWYDRAASQKDAIAMYNLSNMYWKGKGVGKNLDIAIYWCTEAAEQGDTAAQVRVAEILHERSDLASKDHEKMMYWLDLAANENNPKAQYLLGKFYIEGIGTEQDIEEGMAWYHEAASRGYSEAQYALARLYRLGETIEADEALCFSWCSKASKQGHPGAIAMLARLFDTGKGCKKDHTKALQLYEEAVSKNDPAAQFYLGYVYQHGSKLVEVDLKKAFELYLKASEQGEKRAQSNLGSMYKKGMYVEQDFKKAAYWYQKSADQDHARGQANLGLLYENGLGVEKNYEEAAKWYYRAACQNNEKAQLRFALLCQQGLGVRQNEVEAVYWFESAAKQGNPVALYNMGRAYEDGVLVEQNYLKAAQMYEEAVSKGNPEAKLRLAHLHEQGTGVARNEKLALEYFEQAAKDGMLEAQVAFAQRLEQQGKLDQAKQWFTSAAKQGDVSAQFYLGKKAHETKNFKEAQEWYEKAASQSSVQAHLALASLFEEQKMPEKFLFWLRGAADLKHAPSQVQMFENLRASDGERALAYLRQAADGGYAEAQFLIGNILSEGSLVSTDYIGASHYFTQAAQQNHLRSQICLAKAFLSGKGVGRSVDQAVEWLEKAITFESPEAALIMAELYVESDECKDNTLWAYCWGMLAVEFGSDRAKEFCDKLSRIHPSLSAKYEEWKREAILERKKTFLHGITQSQCILGRSYVKGLTKANIALILELSGSSALVLGAKQLRPSNMDNEDHPETMYKKAVRYHHGSEYTMQDFVQAKHWYGLAAEKGHVESMYSLGNIALLGLGGPVNMEDAIKWYNQAGDCDYLPALKSLGMIYNAGKQVKRDPIAAFCFYMQAAESHQDKEASLEIEKLDKEDSKYRREYRERKNDALEERRFVLISGFHQTTGANSVLHKSFLSPMFTTKIIRSILKFAGDHALVVRRGEDMFDFLATIVEDIKEMEKKAIAGDKEYQFKVASTYFNGTDEVKTDYFKAGYWFTAAARQDHVEAMFKLGNMYERGIGFKKDMERAIDWYEGAAKLGHVESLKFLGSMAKTGADQDYLEAYCWFHLAYEYGDATSKKELEMIEAKEKSVKREYNDLRATALAQRNMSLLMGFHPNSKGSVIHTAFKVKYPKFGIPPDSHTQKTDHDLVRMIMSFSSDSLLFVNPGMDLMEFLKVPSESESEKESKEEEPPPSRRKSGKTDINRTASRKSGDELALRPSAASTTSPGRRKRFCSIL
jgi:TPR repeat protein